MGETASAGGSVRYQVATGAVVTATARQGDLTGPWFGSFWLRGSRVYRAFEAAPVGAFEAHLEQTLRGKLVERLAVQGGELLLGHDPENSTSLAAWRGRWHDLYTWISGPLPDARKLAGIYADLAITDGPSGATARPRLPSQVKQYGIEAKTWIPGIAFLTVLDGADAVDLVPAWAGARVRSGEVWRKTVDGGDGGRGRELYVHASSTAVTLALPDRPDDPDAGQRVLDFVADLDVTWA